MDFKVGLFIPADALTLIQSFIMLFFIQNAKQPVPKCKAKLRKSVVQLPVIKGGMLGESNGKRDAVGFFLGRCSHFLAFGDDRFQMVVGRVFL